MYKKSKTKSILFLLFILFAVGFNTSCKNDIDINAAWTETLVIYGIIEPGLDQQKIRVSRAFQNEKTSALAAAQISDSFFLDTVIVSISDLSKRH